jgi:transketolase
MEYNEGPAFLSLTRQALPNLDRDVFAPASGVRRGAYVLADAEGELQVILIATGSEVSLIVEARETLQAEGIGTRVVSMPSWTLFSRQPREYRDEVLPPDVRARVAVEAASPLGWDRWVGSEGRVIGISHFGASAPAKEIFTQFGFTPEKIAAAAKASLGIGSDEDAEQHGGFAAAGPAKHGTDER